MTRDDEASGPLEKEALLPVWDKPEPYFQILDKLSSIVPSHKNPSEPRICTSKVRVRAIEGGMRTSSNGTPLSEVQSFDLRPVRPTV